MPRNDTFFSPEVASSYGFCLGLFFLLRELGGREPLFPRRRGSTLSRNHNHRSPGRSTRGRDGNALPLHKCGVRETPYH